MMKRFAAFLMILPTICWCGLAVLIVLAVVEQGFSLRTTLLLLDQVQQRQLERVQ